MGHFGNIATSEPCMERSKPRLPLPAGKIIMVKKGKRNVMVYHIHFPKASEKAQAAQDIAKYESCAETPAVLMGKQSFG